MLINPINAYLAVIAFANFALAILIFLKAPKTKENLFFCLTVFSAALWTFCMAMFRSVNSESVLIWSQLLWLSTIPILHFFLYFSLNFTKETRVKPIFHFLTTTLSLVTLFFIGLTGILKEFLVINGYRGFIFLLPNFYFYSIYIICYFIATFIILFRKYFQSTGVIKTQLILVTTGTLISAIGGVVFGIFLPLLGNFKLYWLSPGLTSTLACFTAYAILKHRLFNIKVIAAELLNFSIWILLLSRFLLAKTLSDKIIDGGLLAFVILFGIFLIRSVLREVEQREKLEKITVQLEAANERLKQLDEAKSEFLSIASHQLRTPLTSIKGLLSMLLEEFWGPLNAEQKKYLAQVTQSSDRLLRLIEDLLNISRIEAGRMQFDLKPMQLEELVEDDVKELLTQAEAKGLYLKFDKPKQLLPKVSADSLKIRQVIQNLIDNSIKYTETGGSTIDIFQQNNEILFSIKDTGIGLPPGQHLFEKFERGQKASSQHTEGMGLGLYLADKIIKAHNGRIWAESKGEGKGSAFFFSLPIA